MLTKLLKLLVSPLLIPFVFASSLEAVLTIGESATLDQFKWILAGSVGFLVLTPVLLSQNLNFLRIFEHETGHMLTHLMFFRTIDEFTANGNKGEVKSRGPAPIGWITSLAPYYLPVFTLPLLLARPFVAPAVLPAVDLSIGVTMGFHYYGLLEEFGTHQSDIQKHTLPFSFLVVFLFNVWVLILVSAVVLEDFTFLVTYVQRSFDASVEAYGVVMGWLSELGFLKFLPTSA